MPQLITIGETMAAFTPDSVGALRYVQNFGIRTAGAESNVAVGLAKLGLEAAWVSRLGTDEFGCFIRNQLRAEGVDCSRVIYDPDHRTGIMFKETGVGETKVFYYRENSAASHLCPEDVTPALLDGVKVLHMSGITPVLSESCLAMTKAAFALAKEKGVAISFDPSDELQALGRARRHPSEPRYPAQHPRKPVLGVHLQHHRHPAGRRCLHPAGPDAQSDVWCRRHEPFQLLRGQQRPAAEPV